jgi:hypothetical protein
MIQPPSALHPQPPEAQRALGPGMRQPDAREAGRFSVDLESCGYVNIIVLIMNLWNCRFFAIKSKEFMLLWKP